MVILYVKKGNEDQFLYETSVEKSVDEVVADITAIYNGRLKISRLCMEIEELWSHGTALPPEMQGLTPDQVVELKLTDPWELKCAPPNSVQKPDEMGRRCGRAPPPNLVEVLQKASIAAKDMVSKKLILVNRYLTQSDVANALREIRGAVQIVYPGGLPPHDPVKQELDNREELEGTQASLEVLDPARAALWCCGRRLLSGGLLKDQLGANEKTKVIAKLCSSSDGAPSREPVLSEEQRKEMMLHAYRRQEELKYK